jgi:phage head maturation protease
MKLYGEISKTEEQDDGTIKVWGYASTESVDSDGETVTAEAMKAALPDYMKFGAVREMHQAKAAGTAIEANVEDDGRTYFGALVVDSEAVKKVKAGVYKGFSIGGKVTSRDEMNKSVIKGIKLVEVSLVDRPANPEAVFTMYKSENVEDEEAPVSPNSTDASASDSAAADVAQKADATMEALTVPAIDALAEMLNKGEISPEKLLELAKADKEQPAEPVEKAEEKPDLKKYMGEEIYDAATAIEALMAIMYLLTNETYEPEQNAEQIAALKAVIENLKRFIASEIQEDNSVEMADKGGDLEKAGARNNKADKARIQTMHDTSVELGADCGAEKAEGTDDLAKMTGDLDLAKAEISKLTDELSKAQARVAELEAKPAAGAMLKALVVDKDGTAKVLEGADEPVSKVAPVVDAKGEVNEIATMIKAAHISGGVAARA